MFIRVLYKCLLMFISHKEISNQTCWQNVLVSCEFSMKDIHRKFSTSPTPHRHHMELILFTIYFNISCFLYLTHHRIVRPGDFNRINLSISQWSSRLPGDKRFGYLSNTKHPATNDNVSTLCNLRKLISDLQT